MKPADHTPPPDQWPRFSDREKRQFREDLGWVAVLIAWGTGLLLELLGMQVLCHWNQATRTQFRFFTEVAFPLVAIVSLDFAQKEQMPAVIPSVLALWKFGYPDAFIYWRLAISNNLPKSLRLANMVTTAAMQMHHVGAVIAFIFVSMGIVAPNKRQTTIAMATILVHLGTTFKDLSDHYLWQCLMWLFVGSMEIFFQMEIAVYWHQAAWPMNLAVVMLSLSHLLCIFVLFAFVYCYGRAPYFYVPRGSSRDDVVTQVLAED